VKRGKTSIARLQQRKQPATSKQLLCKRVSMAAELRDSNGRYERNNRATDGSSVLCWVPSEAM
jgi:hypothetical protein